MGTCEQTGQENKGGATKETKQEEGAMRRGGAKKERRARKGAAERKGGQKSWVTKKKEWKKGKKADRSRMEVAEASEGRAGSA